MFLRNFQGFLFIQIQNILNNYLREYFFSGYSLLKTQNVSEYASMTSALAGKLSGKVDAIMFIYGSIRARGKNFLKDNWVYPVLGEVSPYKK
jgi:hypothetical protein